MIYKVYASNVTVTKAITEITEEEVKEYICQETDDFFGHIDLDFLPRNEDNEIEDSVMNNCFDVVYDLIDELWNKNRVLECGDFKIVEADEAPSRPNRCSESYTDIDAKDIISKMEL